MLIANSFVVFSSRMGLFSIDITLHAKYDGKEIKIDGGIFIREPNNIMSSIIETFEFPAEGGLESLSECLADIHQSFNLWFFYKRIQKGTSFETPLVQIWDDLRDWLVAFYFASKMII